MSIHHAPTQRGGTTPDAATSPSGPAASGAPPRITIPVKPCGYCRHEYALTVLWNVLGIGPTCPDCLELLREEARSA